MSDVEKLNKKFAKSKPNEIINWALNKYESDIVIATAFGNTGMVIIDMVSKTKLPFKIMTVDTGRLPEETYKLMDDVREKYKIPIDVYYPNYKDIEKMYEEKGFYSFKETIFNRKECCRLRKVLPFYRALKNYKAWFSGLRKEQSITRSHIKKFEIDRKHNNILKINPLADWTEEQVLDYIKSNNVPYNELYDKNYTSIGCECCTRAIEPGEGVRTGRWWWESEENKECGIHIFGPPQNVIVYLDFDGTLLDTQNRHYEVYKDILKNSSKPILSREAYWALKRAGFSVFEIFKQTEGKEEIKSFTDKWMSKIESKDYLTKDILFPKIYEILDILSQEYKLMLISGRKNRKGLLEQLDELNLTRYFSEILSSPAGKNPAKEKENLIMKSSKFDENNTWIVGDTEADIVAGKRLGIKTVGVLSGVRNETKMKELQADYIIDDITKLPELLFFENSK